MPRLRKGETAIGIDARSNAKIETIKRRAEIFSEILCQVPNDNDILKHYCSVENLAAWICPEKGVYRVSVKTLRKYFVSFYARGVAEACERAREMSETGRPELLADTQFGNDSISNLKKKNERAVDAALEMTARYLDLLERISKVSRRSDIFSVELDKHLNKFGRNPHLREAQ